MHASHVIIRGHVFPYADKSPFVASGLSIMGAVEYNAIDDKSKCHECGEWRRGLGNHIRSHGLKRVDYNRRHGLSKAAALGSPTIREKHRVNAERQVPSGTGLRSPQAIEKSRNRHAKSSGTKIWPRSYDSRNEKGQCAAQTLFRVQSLACRLQRTPTERDLRSAGISRFQVINVIGSWEKTLRLLGLRPNTQFHLARPIPEDYPTLAEIKRKWGERMPWPKEYFDFELIALGHKP